MRIITTHKNMDFDGLASMVAANLIYPGSIIVVPSRMNPQVRNFISLHKDLIPYRHPSDIDTDTVRELIVVDASQWSRIEGLDSLSSKSGLEIHVWDHHPQESDMQASWSCIEPVGAAVTLLVERIISDEIDLSRIQATVLAAGIYEDTGYLSFDSTTVRDAAALAHLLGKDADLGVIRRSLQTAYGQKQKDVLFEMISQSDRKQVQGYMVSVKQVEIHGHTPNLSMVVDMYREIINVDAAFGIFHDRENDACMIIGRSTVDGIDAGAILTAMGGGGHAGAAAARLRNIGPDEVEQTLWKLLEAGEQTGLRITDLMSSPVATISPDTPIKEAETLLREKGHTGMPVTENGKLVGMVSRRDLEKLRGKGQRRGPVSKIMNRNVLSIGPDEAVIHSLNILVSEDIGRLPVVKDGMLLGIITRSDILRHYYSGHSLPGRADD